MAARRQNETAQSAQAAAQSTTAASVSAQWRQRESVSVYLAPVRSDANRDTRDQTNRGGCGAETALHSAHATSHYTANDLSLCGY